MKLQRKWKKDNTVEVHSENQSEEDVKILAYLFNMDRDEIESELRGNAKIETSDSIFNIYK